MSFWGKVFLPSHAGLFVLSRPARFLPISNALHLGRLRGQGFVLARIFGLVARLNGMCPAGIAAFLFMLFWPPPAGADGGLLGAAAPPRPPLHSPRTTPLGLSPISTPTDWPLGAFHTPSFREGCAASAPGASSLRSAISLRAAQCQRSPSRWMRGRGRRVGCMESQIE